jgi:hypothetical protein
MQVNSSDHTTECLESHMGRRMTCGGCSFSAVSKRQNFYAWLQDENRSAEEIATVKQILNNHAFSLRVQ